MKTVIIPDLHGKTCWKSIDFNAFDKVIFLGDYVDDDTVPNNLMIENLQQIIQLKLNQKHKVELLLGNHDIQYLEFPEHSCSGLNRAIQVELTNIFQSHYDLFTIGWQHQHHLFTHAGISQKYLNWLETLVSLQLESRKPDALAAWLNDLRKSNPALVYACGYRRGGIYPHGGPVWADLTETRYDYLPYFHQVVGHTKQAKHVTYPQGQGGESKGSITYIDVLNVTTEFLELNLA